MAIVKKLNAAPGEPRRLEIFCPADLKKIGEIESMTPEDIAAALQRARVAQKAWAKLSFKQRGEYMLKALDVLLERQDEFMDVILKDTPKARGEALTMDIFTAADSLLFYAKNAEKYLKPEKRKMHGVIGMTKKLEIHYKPLGVIGVVSPWNAPFILSLNPAIQALMGGNAVMIKPSSATPFAGGLVGKLFAEAGLPKDLVTIIQGDSAAGQALLEVGCDKISFTGSEGVGRHVGVTCAERFIPCSLELGGKNPFIVCADADLERAAAGALAGNFLNAGQYCGGNELTYIEASAKDEFLSHLKSRADKLTQATSGEFDVGAIYTADQLALVEELVDDAIQKGATVIAGGKRNPDLEGLYFLPTILTDVTDAMRITKEEAFGPVMCVIPFDKVEAVIETVNATNYGLTASIWSKDVEKAKAIGLQIDTGCIDVNAFAGTYGSAEAPFGGRKASGIGQVNGVTGLRSYCHAQPVQVDSGGGKSALSMYPKTAKADEGMQKFVKFLYGTKFGRFLAMISR